MEYRKKGDAERPQTAKPKDDGAKKVNKYREKKELQDAYDAPRDRPVTAKTDKVREVIDGDKPRGRGGRGRGARGGRGAGERNDDDRGETRGGARGADRGTRGKRGDDRGGRGGGERYREEPRGERGGFIGGDRRRKDLDTDSWQWKYKNEVRPTYPAYKDIEVTESTVLEPYPTKEETIKLPNKDKYRQDMDRFDQRAEECKGRIQEGRDGKKKVFEGGKIKGQSKTFSQEITDNINTVKKLRDERRAILDQLSTIKEKTAELDKQKQRFSVNIPRNYHNEEDLKQAISDKQNRYETKSLSNQEEKKLLQEIDKLKKLIPDMKQLSAIEPQLQKLRAERQAFSKQLDALKVKIEGIEDTIQDVKAQSQNQRNHDQGIYDQADVFSKQVEELNKELSSIYQKKDELREEHFKGLYQYELQRDKQRHLGDVRRKKDLLVRGEKELTERINKKKEEIANRANPNDKEIEACVAAIAHCNRLKRKYGLVPPTSEELAVAAQKEINQFDHEAGLKKKLENKSIQMHVAKEEITQVGEAKKKKGKKPKAAKDQAAEGFQIDFHVLQCFGAATVSPPQNAEQLDEKIKELEERMAIFEKSGDEDLEKHQADLEAGIEAEARKELAREREEERKNREDPHGYGAQNGHPYEEGKEGDEDSEASDAQEKPRAKKSTRDDEGGYFGNKNKFGDDEEESQATAGAYAAPRRGGAKAGRGGARLAGGGGKSYKFDDADYPSL